MSSKAYLFVYDDNCGNREQVKAGLNTIQGLAGWRYDLPSSFYLLSPESAKELAERLREAFPEGLFVVSEVGSNVWGWLSKQSWHLIENKELLQE